MNDEEIRRRLKLIDDDDAVDVTRWEADFIESVVYKYNGPLSDQQRAAAEKIIEKYG